jgi:hypothetical protein
MRLRGPFITIGALGLAVLAVGLVAVWTSTSRPQARHTTRPTSRPRARHTTRPTSRPRARHTTRLSTTITINSAVTFAPPPTDARPALTAEQARRQAERHQGSRVTPSPPGLTVKLGLLSVLVGPYCGAECNGLIVKNGLDYQKWRELAWGYSGPSTCVSGNDLHPLPPRPCVMWEFVDANTGWMIIGTEQFHTGTVGRTGAAVPTR